MRINFQTEARPDRISRRLKKKLDERGYDIGKCRARETTAHMYGYQSWNDLLGCIGRRGKSPEDEQVASNIVDARRAQFVAALVEIGVSQIDADSIVAVIGPTRELDFLHRAPRSEWEDLLAGVPEFVAMDNASARDVERARTILAARSFQVVNIRGSRAPRRDKA